METLLAQLSWIKWVAFGLLGIAAAWVFIKMGGHHLTEPFFKQCGALLRTRAGKWLSRSLIASLVLAGVGWGLLAGYRYLEGEQQAVLASNEERVQQEAFSLLYRVLSMLERGSETTGDTAPGHMPWYRAAWAKVHPGDTVQQSLGCMTQPFKLIDNNPDVVATVSINNDGNARSMKIIVNEPDSGVTNLADMKLRITERDNDTGTLVWVLERDSLTLRGFPDDASYYRGAKAVFERIFIECAASNTPMQAHR